MSVTGKTFSELTSLQQADMRDAMRGYKVYRAIMKGNGASPPTVTILENTTGLTLSWGGGGTSYVATLLNGWSFSVHPSSSTLSYMSVEFDFYDMNNINYSTVFCAGVGTQSMGNLGVQINEPD